MNGPVTDLMTTPGFFKVYHDRTSPNRFKTTLEYYQLRFPTRYSYQKIFGNCTVP
jgi:hypothetical protein